MASGARVDVQTRDGIAVVSFSRPPANALCPALLEPLFVALHDLQQRPDVKALVVTGANGKFSTGYDIAEFGQPGFLAQTSAQLPSIHTALRTLLETGLKPSVAAIEGTARGGGLELAMACNARVAIPGATLGLPELQLGVIPGFGGTQRLPRLIGLAQALDLMLSSRVIKAEEAQQMGLVDLVAEGELLEASRAVALDLAEGRRLRQAALDMSDKLGRIWGPWEALAAGRGRHAELCVEAVRWGVEKGGSVGLEKEAECFRAAASLDYHKSRLQLYFAYRALKKLRGWGALPATAALVKHLCLYWLLEVRGAIKRWLGME